MKRGLIEGHLESHGQNTGVLRPSLDVFCNVRYIIPNWSYFSGGPLLMDSLTEDNKGNCPTCVFKLRAKYIYHQMT